MSVCGRTLEGILGKSHGFIQCTICFQCLMTSDFFPLSAIGYLQLVMSLLPPTHTRKSFKTLFTVNWILFFIDSFRELLCGTPVLGLSLKRKPGIQVMFWATLDPVWLNDGWIVHPVLGAFGLVSPSDTIINLLKTKRNLLYLKTQFVPRSKHFPLRL